MLYQLSRLNFWNNYLRKSKHTLKHGQFQRTKWKYLMEELQQGQLLILSSKNGPVQ